MQPKLFVTTIVFLFISFNVQAAMGGLGFGSSAEESSYSESPFGTILFFDYALNARSTLGVEHMRSWSIAPFSTAVGFTNLSYRYYLKRGVPVLKDQIVDGENFVHFKAIDYYVGGGLGFGQGSVKQSSSSSNASSVGLSLTLAGGVDYNYYDNMGLNAQFSYSMTLAGTGSLSLFNLVAGIYFGF